MATPNEPTVEIRFYHWGTGELFDVRHYNLPENAFNNMLATRKPAHAISLADARKVYFYHPEQDGHTLAGFLERLGM